MYGMSDKVDFEEIASEYNLEVQEVIFDIIKVRDAIEAPTPIARKSRVVALVTQYFATNGYLQHSYRTNPDWVQPSGDPTSANKKGKDNSAGSSDPPAYSKATNHPRSAQPTASGNQAGNLRLNLDASTDSRRAQNANK